MIVNGVETEKGEVSARDRGFTLGDGLFETMAVYNGAPFALDRHMERLSTSAALLRIPVPFNSSVIRSAIVKLAGANSAARGVARLTLTRGEGARGYGIEGCGAPSWTLTVEPYEPMPEAKRAAGLTLSLSRHRKNHLSPISGVKSISALERVIMFAEAKESGADEALALSAEGKVASGVSVNVFWMKGGKLYTPSSGCGALMGITRGFVIEIASSTGIETVEGRFELDELKTADEIFVTNSLMEIAPVSLIGGIFEAKKEFAAAGMISLEYCKKTADCKE